MVLLYIPSFITTTFTLQQDVVTHTPLLMPFCFVKLIDSCQQYAQKIFSLF